MMMTSDGHHSSAPYALFPSSQASVHAGGGNNDRLPLPFTSIPNVEQDTASYLPWSHHAHDDPYGLISWAHNSTKSRKPTDHTNCDGETDLQGLVLNILDEADSQDSYYSQGSIPTCNPVWSPKTLEEEILQRFQSEAQLQQNPAFEPNFISRETLSKVHGQPLGNNGEEFYQQSNGFASNQQWLLNLPNGDRDGYSLHPQKLPPGLSMPPMGNTYQPQMQQNKYNNMSADRDRENSRAMNNYFDLSDVCRPQSKMTNTGFHPNYEDLYIMSSTRPISNEQHVAQDFNQLVSSLQSCIAGKHGDLGRGDFSNTYRQRVGMHHDEDSMVEQKQRMQAQKQLIGDLAQLQMERNGVKQTYNCGPLHDRPSFSPQKTELYQQQKPFSTFLKLPNQYQDNMAMSRENNPLPFNMSMNQYSKCLIQQDQNKPKMQREKKKMNMSGLLGEGFSPRPLTNAYTRDKKKAEFQRFGGENGLVSAGNTKQLIPLMYPVNDPRRNSSLPVNSFTLNSRSSLPFGNGVPTIDVGDIMSPNDPAAFNSYVSDMKTQNGDGTYGMTSAMTNSTVMTPGGPGGPVVHLYFYLDKCYEEWKSLEKERMRAEVILNKAFLGKRTASATTTNLPNTPPNPTRVDTLIVNQAREQARVASLLDRMECLQSSPLHVNIHTALNRHHMAICITQARRTEEIANMSKHQKQRAHFTEGRDTLLVVFALKDLAATTRKLHTAVWSTLQMTLPKGVRRPDPPVSREAANTDRSPSPFQGYSFRM